MESRDLTLGLDICLETHFASLCLEGFTSRRGLNRFLEFLTDFGKVSL